MNGSNCHGLFSKWCEKKTGNNTTGLLEDEDKCEDEGDAAQSTNMKNGNNGENIEYQSKSLYLSLYKKGITAV